MSDVNKAICHLINAFSKYAGKDGNAQSLSKAELSDLLKNELGELLGKADNKEAVDRIFKELDSNQDNQVDFTEFGRLVLSLTVMCHDYFTSKK